MILKTEFPNHKKENDSGNKIMNNRIFTLKIRLNQMEKIVDFLYENFEHIKGVKNVVVDILSRFVGIQPDEAL